MTAKEHLNSEYHRQISTLTALLYEWTWNIQEAGDVYAEMKHIFSMIDEYKVLYNKHASPLKMKKGTLVEAVEMLTKILEHP